MMKMLVYFLAIISCAVALPLETLDELDLSNLTWRNIFYEPINKVQNDNLPGSRIIGGAEVTPHIISYQVAVIVNGNSLCGGSLISSTTVLTAAHCTIDASFVNVRLGAHYYNQDEVTQVRLTSTNVINHESYGVGSFTSNDISLVILPYAVMLSINIMTIPLAPSTAGSFEGSTALLTGWGRTTDSSMDSSPVLLGVNLDIISNTACRNIFGSVVLDSNICTSGQGPAGGCTGDSGGPLAVDGVQVGIVSFGSARCEDGTPTVYARISSYRSWIQQNAGV